MNHKLKESKEAITDILIVASDERDGVHDGYDGYCLIELRTIMPV